MNSLRPCCRTIFLLPQIRSSTSSTRHTPCIDRQQVSAAPVSSDPPATIERGRRACCRFEVRRPVEMQLTVRKKRKKSVEEKIKSNQMKILQQPTSVLSLKSGRASCNQSRGCPRDDSDEDGRAQATRSRWEAMRLPKASIRRLSRPALWQAALVILHALALQCRASTLSDFDGATFYKAPVGSRIRIACNASHWNDDSISLVLWFKGNPAANSGAQLQPIYTVDARQKPLSSGQARHLVADAYKGRARFIFPEAPSAPSRASNSSAQVPFLDLVPIEADDQGEYRCRVDYRSRPRENFLIILFVLVPPRSVEITDSSGRALEQIYGPLNEGSELKLVCLARGGRPPPAIVWRRAGHVIDDSYLTLNDFLTLKLANASSEGQLWRRDNDLALESGAHNQTGGRTQQRQELQQSDSARQLAIADWLTWPEFNYFHSQVGGQQQQQAATPLWSPRLQSKQQPQQLIDWQVDGSTVTGVNVLHLSELTRAHLTEEAPQPEGALPAVVASRRAGAGPIVGAPKLECHASNLHYDLHSLIRLFAPPSLQATNDESDADRNNNTAQQQQQRTTGWNSTPAPLALSQAIERAIWANVRTASEQTEANEIRPSSARVAHLHRQQHNHHHHHHQQQQQQQPEDAPSSATVAGPNWPLVIEQQLIRPHRLVEASLSSAAEGGGAGLEPASSSEQPASSKSTPPSPSHLSRSKLIALEANLRPLDVRITSPSRALAAGQVHEFTCQSRGSWPAAKLSWLKDGRPLDSGQHQQPPSAATHQAAVPARDTPSPLASATTGETYKLSPAWPASPLISQSKLTIKLEREDHNARISCRAENEHYRRAAALTRRNQSLAASSGSDEVVVVGSGASGGGGGGGPSLEQDEDRNWQLEDSIALNVHYAPQVRLELGTRMLSERIRENQDIYFVCRCDANPAVSEITWLHNDRPINESRAEADVEGAAPLDSWSGRRRAHSDNNKLRLAAGDVGAANQQPPRPTGGNRKTPPNLIVSNDSLVLQRVQIEQSGQYNCLASNSEGVGLSNQIELRVLHAPICVASHRGRVEAGPLDGAEGGQSGGPAALRLGSFALTAPAAGEPIGAGERPPALQLACQMLVPHEDDQQTPAGDNQLEFSWYLNSTSSERRLLARQTSRDGDVKLIDAAPAELLGLPWQVAATRPRPDTHPPSGAAHHQRKSAAAVAPLRLAVAHLNLSWEQATLGLASGAGEASLARTGAQIGQVFCLARNALGEQRRACHYSIEVGEPRWGRSGADYQAGSRSGASSNNNNNNNNNGPNLARFSCLFVNVTASSAWIGCDSWASRRRHQSAASAAPAQASDQLQLEITQVEENNDRLRPALARGSNENRANDEAGHEFRFNVLVFSLGAAQAPDRSETTTTSAAAAAAEPVRQLEANLSSGPLDEALFAVVNLQPNTKYLLEIDDLSQSWLSPSSTSFDQRQRETATVSLKTLAANEITRPQAVEGAPDGLRNGSGGGGSASRPSIRQVTEPHPPDLLAAALTSTRSNNGHQLYALDHKLQRTPAGSGAHREQSMWASWMSALAQLVGLRFDSFANDDQRPQARARRPPALRTSDHHSTLNTSHLLANSDHLLALCAYVLALLLVMLVGVFVLNRSRLCIGMRANGRSHRSSPRHDAAKTAHSAFSGKDTVSSGGHDDNNHELELEGRFGAGDERKRPPSTPTSTSQGSSASPRKQPMLDAPTTTNLSTRSGSSVGATGASPAAPAPPGRVPPDHHYSTLNSRAVAQFQQQQRQQPTINFLKTSSITSASSTLTRAPDWRSTGGQLQQRNHFHHHHQQHQQHQQQHHHQHQHASLSPLVMDVLATDHQARLGVSRSRSSLGFGGGGDMATNLASSGGGLAGEPNSLLLLAQIQTATRDGAMLDAATTKARPRLLQPVEATGLERAALLADELRLQTSRGLISDANFPFAIAGTTSTASTTTVAANDVAPLDGRKLRHPAESAAPADSRLSICNQTPTLDVADLRGQSRFGKPSVSSPQQCNCDGLQLELATCAPPCNSQDKLMGPGRPGVCYSPAEQQQQQSYPGFIELLPDVDDYFGANQQSAIISCSHQSDAGTPNNIMLSLQQRPHYHHVIFNQSLNSSSIGSPSTNNQYGSSPLGSTTPSNTESYQYTTNTTTNTANNNNNNNNNLILVTAAHGDQRESDLDCSAKQMHEHTFNANSTSNYSSDNSSQATANSTQANRKQATSKQRSILKNCNRPVGDESSSKNQRPVQGDQARADCDED